MKLLSFILLFLMTVLVAGCKKSEESTAVFLRVENVSNSDYFNIKVYPMGSGTFHVYGDLPAGAISKYHAFDRVNISVGLYVGDTENSGNGVGYFDEENDAERLQPGKYTLKINNQNGLSQTMEKD